MNFDDLHEDMRKSAEHRLVHILQQGLNPAQIRKKARIYREIEYEHRENVLQGIGCSVSLQWGVSYGWIADQLEKECNAIPSPIRSLDLDSPDWLRELAKQLEDSLIRDAKDVKIERQLAEVISERLRVIAAEMV